MATDSGTGGAPVKSGAEIRELAAKVGLAGIPPRVRRRAKRLLDGEVFTDPAAAARRRQEIRASGKKARYTKANVGGEIVHVVKEV